MVTSKPHKRAAYLYVHRAVVFFSRSLLSQRGQKSYRHEGIIDARRRDRKAILGIEKRQEEAENRDQRRVMRSAVACHRRLAGNVAKALEIGERQALAPLR